MICNNILMPHAIKSLNISIQDHTSTSQDLTVKQKRCIIYSIYPLVI